MSRYRDHSDDYSPEAVLAQGRWENNARRVLRSRRGQRALADLRAALLALPQKRLVYDALCTAGDPLARFPEVTQDELDAARAKAAEWYLTTSADEASAAEYADYRAANLREQRDGERADFTDAVDREGQGVCAIGAYVWWQKVRDGMDPDEAFASLPTLTTEDGDPLDETAGIGQNAGLAYTLAWELAYRNDETYGSMTPEERYAAFLAWVDSQLAPGAVSAG